MTDGSVNLLCKYIHYIFYYCKKCINLFYHYGSSFDLCLYILPTVNFAFAICIILSLLRYLISKCHQLGHEAEL